MEGEPLDAEDFIKLEPPWISEVARQERWGQSEWEEWHMLARRFFGDFRVKLERTDIGPYADASDLPFMSEITAERDERPWLAALHRLCIAVAEFRRSQGWKV
jgi:hypothetical protein